MATRRSTYIFQSETDYEEARGRLYREMRDDYDDNKKIYFYGWWGTISHLDWENSWRIDIYSECTDVAKAADIIREHRGRYYEIDD